MLRIALRVRLRQRLTSFPTASAQDDTSEWRWRLSFAAGRRGRRPLPGYGKALRLCVGVGRNGYLPLWGRWQPKADG